MRTSGKSIQAEEAADAKAWSGPGLSCLKQQEGRVARTGSRKENGGEGGGPGGLRGWCFQEASDGGGAVIPPRLLQAPSGHCVEWSRVGLGDQLGGRPSQ